MANLCQMAETTKLFLTMRWIFTEPPMMKGLSLLFVVLVACNGQEANTSSPAESTTSETELLNSSYLQKDPSSLKLMPYNVYTSENTQDRQQRGPRNSGMKYQSGESVLRSSSADSYGRDQDDASSDEVTPRNQRNQNTAYIQQGRRNVEQGGRFPSSVSSGNSEFRYPDRRFGDRVQDNQDGGPESERANVYGREEEEINYGSPDLNPQYPQTANPSQQSSGERQSSRDSGAFAPDTGAQNINADQDNTYRSPEFNVPSRVGLGNQDYDGLSPRYDRYAPRPQVPTTSSLDQGYRNQDAPISDSGPNYRSQDPSTVYQGPNYRGQDPSTANQGPNDRSQDPSTVYRGPDYRSQDPSTGYQSPDYRNQNPAITYQGTDYRSQDPSVTYQNRGYRNQDPSSTYGRTGNRGRNPSIYYQDPLLTYGSPGYRRPLTPVTRRGPNYGNQSPEYFYPRPSYRNQNPSVSYGDPAYRNQNPSVFYGDPAYRSQNPSVSYGDPAYSIQNPSIPYEDPVYRTLYPSTTYEGPAYRSQDPSRSYGDPFYRNQNRPVSGQSPDYRNRGPSTSYRGSVYGSRDSSTVFYGQDARSPDSSITGRTSGSTLNNPDFRNRDPGISNQTPSTTYPNLGVRRDIPSVTYRGTNFGRQDPGSSTTSAEDRRQSRTSSHQTSADGPGLNYQYSLRRNQAANVSQSEGRRTGPVDQGQDVGYRVPETRFQGHRQDVRNRDQTTDYQRRSSSIPDEQNHRPFSFNYVSEADDGMYTHQQTSDNNGRVVGSYAMSLEDGRRRIVEYIADENGFRASIDTNEPGTRPSENPADVVYYSGRYDANRPTLQNLQGYRPQQENKEVSQPIASSRLNAASHDRNGHDHYYYYRVMHNSPISDDQNSHNPRINAASQNGTHTGSQMVQREPRSRDQPQHSSSVRSSRQDAVSMPQIRPLQREPTTSELKANAVPSNVDENQSNQQNTQGNKPITEFNSSPRQNATSYHYYNYKK